MYGAIFGDIIGSRFEFDSGPWTKEFDLFAYGCGYTDDTVMTIAIAEALLEAGKDATVEEIEKCCIQSMQKWGQKYPTAGYGGRFYGWLFHTKNPKPYGSFGNGSAMRVSSVGLLYDSLERTREVARATANVTHNHPEGLKGAECVAAVMYLARTGANKEAIKAYVTEEFGYDISQTVDELRPFHKHDETCMDALPKALIAFFEGTSYEDVVRNAVSLGGDTDTIAAIAGAMAEAYFGVPAGILMEGAKYIEDDMMEVIRRFGQVRDGGDKSLKNQRYENNQYIKYAVNQIYENQNIENLTLLLDVLMKRMDEQGEVPTPLVDVNHLVDQLDLNQVVEGKTFSFAGDMRLRFDTMQDKAGKQWIPLFTDEEELERQPTTNVSANIAIEAILRNGLNNPEVEGVVINPFGQPYTIDKTVLEIVMRRYDEFGERK